MRREYRYYVYILQSASRRALYIGVTNNLIRRGWQHQTHFFEGFSDANHTVRLVYYEAFQDVHRALAREKQLKRWSRAKKDALITTRNPHWNDLSQGWYEGQTKTKALSTRIGDDAPDPRSR